MRSDGVPPGPRRARRVRIARWVAVGVAVAAGEVLVNRWLIQRAARSLVAEVEGFARWQAES
jgi:hypothetical protein